MESYTIEYSESRFGGSVQTARCTAANQSEALAAFSKTHPTAQVFSIRVDGGGNVGMAMDGMPYRGGAPKPMCDGSFTMDSCEGLPCGAKY